MADMIKYGSECRALKMDQEHKLQVAEMRMCRMMCGVTRRVRFRNNVHIRECLKIMDIGDMLAQNKAKVK